MSMRWFTVLLAVLLTATMAAAEKKSVEQLKQEAEEAKEGKQVDLLVEVAEAQLQAANDAYAAGNSEQAQAAVKDVSAYGVRAGKAAVALGKKLKHTEISLRKMSQKLQDLGHSVNLDDRPPLAAAVDALEKARTELLNRMFKK